MRPSLGVKKDGCDGGSPVQTPDYSDNAGENIGGIDPSLTILVNQRKCFSKTEKKDE